MENFKTKIVTIDVVEAGMIAAQDIFTDVGQMLIAENTELDERSLRKLRLYGIHDIPVKEFIENFDMGDVSSNPTKELVKNSKEFKVFESSYSDHTVSLKDEMLNISDGKNVDVSQLFSVSEELLTTVKYKSNLFGFLSNLEVFDDYTYTHCLNVSLISHTLGQWLGFTEKQLMHLSVAGLLHDIGKTKIDKSILNKPGKLTEEEFEEMKKHPVYGFQSIEKQDIPYNIKMAVLMHHERYDGSGYPLNAKNNQINDFAKIVAIADVYDALTSNRPYRNKFDPFHVIRQFEQEYFRHLDTKLLMTFLQNIAYCYLDRWCVLSTGEEGKIIFINKHMPSRPIVQVDGTIIDLSQEEDIFVGKII
ncbi:HD-GYP domain-containing protein [Wukongibacter baidiensis]|uniref:HD-GYP domain-containing protein n=1 Tax=Wukongibacter baidiensis TaxID=1723361 RepID=UPI003D7F4A26